MSRFILRGGMVLPNRFIMSYIILHGEAKRVYLKWILKRTMIKLNTFNQPSGLVILTFVCVNGSEAPIVLAVEFW